LRDQIKEYCSQKNLIFYAPTSDTPFLNHFAFDPSMNNAADEIFKKFLHLVASQIRKSGDRKDAGIGGAELVLKETSPEKIDKILSAYRKEAANVSTKASILGEHNARDSIVKLNSKKNDELMKNILQHNI